MFSWRNNHPVSGLVSDQVDLAAWARRVRIATAWDRYNGKFPDSLEKIKSDPQGKDNIKLNLCRFIVDTSAFFLYGKPVGFEVDGKADSEEHAWLQECWSENKQMTLLLDAGTNGGVTGDVFLKIRLPGGNAFPRITVLDTGNIEVHTRVDDCTVAEQFVISWTGVDRRTKKTIAYRQTITLNDNGLSWEIVDEQSEGDNKAWIETNRETWAYPFPPIVHAKNRPCPNSYYGTPDLEEDIIDANEDLNAILSNTKRVIRLHAHPKTWARGIQARDLDTSPDKITVIQSEKGELKNLEMQSDLSSSLEFAREIKQGFHQIACVPEIVAGKLENVGNLSGLAMSILYGPILRLTETKQLFQGEMLVELNKALLEIKRSGKRKVTIQWPDILPKNEKEAADIAVVKSEIGVSKDTLMTEMGYDATAEMEKRQAEQEADQAFGDKLLKQFERDGLTTPPSGGKP